VHTSLSDRVITDLKTYCLSDRGGFTARKVPRSSPEIARIYRASVTREERRGSRIFRATASRAFAQAFSSFCARALFRDDDLCESRCRDIAADDSFCVATWQIRLASTACSLRARKRFGKRRVVVVGFNPRTCKRLNKIYRGSAVEKSFGSLHAPRRQRYPGAFN